MGRRVFTGLVAFALAVLGVPMQVSPATATSPDLVISQIYGGGGNTGAQFTNDFIEIFNRGNASVALTGLSVQYTSATGTGTFGSSVALITPLSGTIAPGQYVLVQEASTAAVGAPLPAPDITDGTPIAMAAGGGKVALVNSAAGLGCNGGSAPCSAAQLAQIIDLIGYDGANFFEGPGAAPTLSNTTAAFRASGGCTDTDNNAADFTAAAPAPRNSASPINACAGDSAPAVASTSPGNGAAGVATNTDIAITFTEPVNVLSGWTSISCATSGAHTYTVSGGPATFTVNPDTDFAGGETCTVTVNAALVNDQDTNDPPDNMAGDATFSFTLATPQVAIHAIQGNGTRSPLVGQVVSTSGVVTATKANGFFIQAPDAENDADPATSEGILVFTSSTPPAIATRGNLVNVTATVSEFVPTADPFQPPLTELVSPTVTLSSTGNPLPAPITLTTADVNPSSSLDALERFEGMRVTVASLTVTGPTLGSVNEPNATATSSGIFYGVLTGVARPFREPGIQAPEPAPSGVPVFDNNPERLRVDSSRAGLINVSAGAIVTGLTGPLDYGFRTYTIFVEPGNPPAVSGGSTPTGVRAPTAREFTVASFNAERFFDTNDDLNTQDAILTTTAFNNRLNKMSLAIRDVLRSPDIIGFQEIENLGVLQAIASRVNADTVAGGGTDPAYVAYLFEGNDIGGIDSGFLVKTSRVTVVDVTQEGKTTTFIQPDGTAALLNDRPPVVLRARINGPASAAYAITVIDNHLRSLSGVNGSDGARIRAKRRAQAEFLANLIQARQVADPNEHIVSLGDYNAFEFNDGYVDTIGTIKGTPTPASQVTLASPDLVDPDLIDLIETVDPAQRYSYVFDGNAQELDHMLVTGNVIQSFGEIEYGRIDADFPETTRNDPTIAARSSDHDPVVAYFNFADTTPPQISAPASISRATGAGASACGLGISDAELGSATATDDVAVQSIVRTGVPLGSVFPVGTTTITYTATDTSGNIASAIQTVTVSDNTAPQIAAPASVTRGTGPGSTLAGAFISDLGLPTASDNCPGVTIALIGGLPNGSIFPIGVTTNTYFATDASGNTATATQTVTVVDDTPPVLTVPANVTAQSDATICGTAVTTGQPSATDNSGSVTVARIDGPPTGSIFPVGTTTITYMAMDAAGNRTTGTQLVTVIDNTAPTIAAPPSVSRAASGVTTFISNAELGAASASDNCAVASIAVSGVPAGNLFPHGTTTITYTATDVSGNRASATQTVTVIPTTTSVCAVVGTLVSNAGVANSLCAKLNAAAAALDRGSLRAHDNQLGAFVHEVNAQRGNMLSDASADALIALAGGL